MPSYKDQAGGNILLPLTPSRIVSLVPSQTELLYDLGLDESIIGITKFCVRPKHWFHHKNKIGGTKTVHIEAVKALQPDLIIANKEENVQEQVAELSMQFPVWTSDIGNLTEALEMIASIGLVTGTTIKASTIIEKIKNRFGRLAVPRPTIRTAYLIWEHPYMTIGGDTFIHDMLTRCGLTNIFEDEQRYPAITLAEIKNRHCQLLLLSSEPFPFKQKHINELQQELPATKIMLADGEMFSWYGSRLLLAPGYFAALIDQMSDARPG